MKPPEPVVAGGSARVEVDPATGRIVITAPWTTSASPTTDVSFGLFGNGDGGPLAETRASLADGLKRVASQLTDLLGQVITELSNLEVETYTSDDIGSVEYDPHEQRYVGPVKRRAITRMRLDGKTAAIVPSRDGALDEQLWAVHCQLVERAQAQRTELLKSVAAAGSSLMGIVKPL